MCTYVCAYDMHMMFTCMRTRAHTCSHHMHIMCTPCAHLCVITYAQPYAHMCMHTAVQPVYSLYEPIWAYVQQYYSTTAAPEHQGTTRELSELTMGTLVRVYVSTQPHAYSRRPTQAFCTRACARTRAYARVCEKPLFRLSSIGNHPWQHRASS